MILGIDPGLHGALAWMEEDGRVVDVQDIPILNEGPRRKTIDASALARLLTSRPVRGAMIEAVHARPTDSKSSAFTFGRHLGALEALIMAQDLPLRRVAPQTWRKAAGLPAGAGKEASIAAALRLCPTARPFLDAKAHDRAEAVLIAAFGVQHAQAA